jgi:hypothetical protein
MERDELRANVLFRGVPHQLNFVTADSKGIEVLCFDTYSQVFMLMDLTFILGRSQRPWPSQRE